MQPQIPASLGQAIAAREQECSNSNQRMADRRRQLNLWGQIIAFQSLFLGMLSVSNEDLFKSIDLSLIGTMLFSAALHFMVFQAASPRETVVNCLPEGLDATWIDRLIGMLVHASHQGIEPTMRPYYQLAVEQASKGIAAMLGHEPWLLTEELKIDLPNTISARGTKLIEEASSFTATLRKSFPDRKGFEHGYKQVAPLMIALIHDLGLDPCNLVRKSTPLIMSAESNPPENQAKATAEQLIQEWEYGPTLSPTPLSLGAEKARAEFSQIVNSWQNARRASPVEMHTDLDEAFTQGCNALAKGLTDAIAERRRRLQDDLQIERRYLESKYAAPLMAA